MAAVAQEMPKATQTPSDLGTGARWHHMSRFVVLATLLIAPLAFGAVQPWAWAGMCMMSGLALALWAIGCSISGSIRLHWSPLYIVNACGLILLLAELFGGRTLDWIGTRESLIKFIGYSTLFFLVGQLSSSLSVRGWRRLGFVVVLYSFAVAVFAIVQFFSAPRLIYWAIKPRWGGEIFGPYVNHNHYAGLFELLLPVCVAAVIALPEHHELKLLGWFAILIDFASVLLCGSRGGAIAITFELVALLALFGFAAHAGSRARVLVMLGVAILSCGLFLWLDPGSVLKRWEITASAPELASGARPIIAADSIRMFRSHALWGVGAGAYEQAFPSYQSWVTEDVIDHAHNDYVELLAETGIMGGLLLLVSLGIFFREAGARIKELSAHPETWVRACAAISCCGLLVHSLMDFNLHIPANAAWFCAMLALVVSPSQQRSAEVQS